MRATLEAIHDARRELCAEPHGAARANARGVLAQAREQWAGLAESERRALTGPALELRALLDSLPHQGSAQVSPETLLERFGLRAFRPGQREAVKAALDGRDSLVVMPTGGGKSLCYQLPALAGGGLVVVVSPLIALMTDQLHRLRDVDVRACMLASGMEDGHNQRALAEVSSGAAQLLLVAPERFGSRALRQALSYREVALFVVDEAHCVAEWGHDFRPDYLRLRDVIATLGHPPVMAATATATPRVAEEIAKRLGLRDPVLISSGFDRPNLTFDVLSLEGKGAVARKRATLLHVLTGDRERRAQPTLPAIVYCGTRKDTDEVAELIAERGLATVSYHAGLTPEQRKASQERFMANDAEVVVATNAFGMGVDKADVRTVAHWALPTSLEAYYQEAGRAGRDGEPARALLLASRMDLGRLIRFITARESTVQDVSAHVDALARQAHDGVLDSARPQSEQERVLLSIAERSGALELEPGSAGGIRLRLTGTLDTDAASAAIAAAKNRGWEAYRAIERFVSEDERCRREQLLEHFGDHRHSEPTGRCCDVCDPDEELKELSGLASVRATRQAAATVPRRPSRVKEPPGEEVDADQFEKLRAWRLGRAAGKPAFTVLSNTVLEEVLRRRPGSIQALLDIHGIGPAKCEQHGESLLVALGGL